MPARENGTRIGYRFARFWGMNVDMPELAKGNDFYVIVGSAAGTLIGLQFVVLTLIADKPPAGAEEAGAAFGSPTIVHFSVALLLSALLHAPWQKITMAASCWGVVGFAGVAYIAIVIGRMRRQPAYKPQFEDWLFLSALPFVAYAMLAMSAFVAASHTHDALFGVGGGCYCCFSSASTSLG